MSSSFLIRASTGTTPTSVRTTAKSWACTATSSSSRPTPDYWPPVNRELLLTLDDILIEDGKVAPFSRSETTYVAMGRFGNVLLVGGEAGLSLTSKLGEVVRLYLTNTANTRVFNVGIEGARMKLVGADSGRYEHEEFVERVVLAPSERAVIDVNFDQSGQVTLEHHTPQQTYPLAAITSVTNGPRPPSSSSSKSLRTNEDMVAERNRIAPFLLAAPDKTLAFVAEMDMGVPEGAVVYTCPMHPSVVRAEEGQLPRVRDEAPRDSGRAHLHVPDASRRRQRRGGALPPVRDEAPRRCDHLRLPDASGGRQRHPRPLSAVRNEATAVAVPLAVGRGSRRDSRPCPREWRTRSRRIRRHRVGRRHGRDQPDHDSRQHALEAD